MNSVDRGRKRFSFADWLIKAIRSLIAGTILCLTPATAVLVLGWLQRRMRYLAKTKAALPATQPGWVLGKSRSGHVERFLGGLAANIREGLMAAIGLALVTSPFTIIWILSWWAGWENSFSKGYEQAFVGPALGLFGVFAFCLIMIWLPMAMAHQAIENRFLAVLEWRRIAAAVRHTGWGYVLFAAATVICALPLFAGRGLVTFASDIIPGFDTMTAEDIQQLSDTIKIVLAAYVFLSLVLLRGWLARIYAHAATTALNSPGSALVWRHAVMADALPQGKRPWGGGYGLRLALMGLIWFGLAAQIFVGQFLNHDWYLWLTHPYFLLPWAG